jgi:aminoglycoside phosphotransferase (APT) family kinase protein
MDVPPQIREVAGRFALTGRATGIEPFPGGHINDSFLLEAVAGDGVRRYLLQRINGDVFPRPHQVMRNIERVTRHVLKRMREDGVEDPRRRFLTLIPTLEGGAWLQDARGDVWRLYHFIEGTSCHLEVETLEQAETAGFSFGQFQQLLSGLDGAPLHEVIHGFHDTPERFAALERAVDADPLGRAAGCAEEIRALRALHPEAAVVVDGLEDGSIPLRPVHNDCKMSNVLIDEASGEALCVVDLDTMMPGSALYDFGDMIRTMTTRAAEDERLLEKVFVELPFFERLLRGYLRGTGGLLVPRELELLAFSGKLITMELAARFLTDHLLGDRYFRIHRPQHNLDRARAQLALVRSLEENRAEMEAMVAAAVA